MGLGNYDRMFCQLIFQVACGRIKRLTERGEPNVRRYLAILGNPALRETVFGF